MKPYYDETCTKSFKALTIHQPFAHLIVTPDNELPIGAVRKRVENRSWSTPYRGLLLIHAGKSLKWMNTEDWPPMPDIHKLRYDDFPEMAFGAIVGAAILSATIGIKTIRSGMNLGPLNWLQNHWHVEGPCCWVLEDARRFAEPIPFRGMQGLFTVPKLDALVKELREL